MEKTKLTKREYLGEGYNLIYRNLKTNGLETFNCSKEEYENTPDKDGRVFVSGNGGFIKVDSETGMLSDKEFTIINNLYYICMLNSLNITSISSMSEEEFNSKYIWQ